MTLYTLVNEKGKPSIGEHFDTTDRDWICPTVSSIMIGDQNVVLGFDSDDMAKEFANRLNGMKNGGNYDFYFSPRIVSEEAESDYRERFANGELDFGFNKIDSMFKKAKRKKIERNKKTRFILTYYHVDIRIYTVSKLIPKRTKKTRIMIAITIRTKIRIMGNVEQPCPLVEPMSGPPGSPPPNMKSRSLKKLLGILTLRCIGNVAFIFPPFLFLFRLQVREGPQHVQQKINKI